MAFERVVANVQETAATYRVEDFGASGDGRTDNTEALQCAIDTCGAKGGGVVILSSGTYLCGTLELKSKVNLHIADDVVLKGIRNLDRYPQLPRMLRDGCSENPNEERKGYSLLYCHRARDVRITGSGAIDVGGEWFQDKQVRPFALRIVESESVCIDGLALLQSAAWCCHVQLSRRVDIRNLTIRSSGIRNGDGLDIDSSSEVTICGCDIATSDDALCFKTTAEAPCDTITVTDCTLKSNCSGVKFGTESVGDFTNIRVSRCTLLDCGVVALKITAVDGGSVRDILFSDLTIQNSTGPIFVATGNRGRRYVDEADPGRRSTIRDVTFRRMEITTRRYERRDREVVVNDHGQGVVVSGRPDHLITNIMFEDLRTSFWGGVEKWDANAGEVPVLTDEYPECHKLGILPAYGYYFQYAENVTLNRCSDQLINPDVRPMRVDGPEYR